MEDMLPSIRKTMVCCSSWACRGGEDRETVQYGYPTPSHAHTAPKQTSDLGLQMPWPLT